MDPREERAWREAWEAAYPESPTETAASPPKQKRRRSPRTRSVVIATGILVLGLAPFGVAATGDALREGKRNGTSTRETEIVGKINASGGAKGGFTTRQSNISNSGGGAIYGCRSTGGTASNPPQEPCLRGNNLRSGLAFEFNTVSGGSAGVITAGGGGDSKKPFTTNATGVATGLNADRVDGQDAAQIVAAARAKAGLDADTVDGASASDLKTRWALVSEGGQIIEQSGGFTVMSRPGINGQPATNPNIYISAGGNLVGKGLSAQTAIQNRIDRTGDGAADPAFTGDIGVGRCNTAAVACAPAGTNNDNTLVVRSLADNTTVTSQTRRFYVEVTE